MLRLLGCVPLLLVAALASAQSEVLPAQFGEEIEVRVIDVDVVVTGRDGLPKMDLTREDFELYEDGKRVEIAYFSRIVDGRIRDVPSLESSSTGSEAVLPRTPLTWIIFIDHTNLPPGRRNQAMQQLQQFMQRAIVQGDRGMIALNDNRSFKIRHGLTDDSKLLMGTLAKMEKERMSVSPVTQRAGQILNELRREESELQPGGNSRAPVRNEDQFISQNTGNDISSLIEEEASRTKNAILAMGALLDTLARVDGRLAMLYVGAGFNTQPGSDLAAAWRARFSDRLGSPQEPRPQDQKDSIQREITRLFNMLSAMRVTVYTIHAGEQSGGPTSVTDTGHNLMSYDVGTDMDQLTEAGHAREMAQRTGGLYFKANQSLASQLDAVRLELSNYYSLGYRPKGSPSDARRVKVKVKADGLRVRHRQTVRERTRQEKAAGAVVASMVQPQPRVVTKMQNQQPSGALPAAGVSEANPLGIAVEAERLRPDGWGRDFLLPFRFTINLDALTFVKANNAHRASFVMHFALVGKDGSVYPLESREQALAVPDTEMRAGANSVVSYSWHVDLAALKIPHEIPSRQDGMRLTVTVEDRSSGVRSVITVPLDGKAS